MSTSLVDPGEGTSIVSESETRLGRHTSGFFPGALLSEGSERFAELTLPTGTARVTYRSPEPGWLWTSLHSLKQLSTLKKDWDSYGSERISAVSIVEALRTLVDVLPKEGSAPAFVPASGGGIQLEWHDGGFDIEVQIASNGKASAYVRNVDNDVVREFDEMNEMEKLELRAILTQIAS